MGKFYDITGWKFGRLTVIKRVPSLPKSKTTTRWLCKCECGNQVEINKNNLVNSHTKSCGCYALEIITGNTYNTTHNQSRTRLYHTWQSMKQRCYDENVEEYKYYGGRGVTVCDEWLDYANFAKWANSNGYKKNLTIDRIDNDGNYTPLNCRWVTIKQQNRNKSTTHYLTSSGVTKCLSEWSEELDIPISTIVNRLNKGLHPEEAISTDYFRRKKGEEENKRRVDVYKKGLTDRESAKTLGMKSVSFCAWRKREGLPAHYKQGGTKI